MALLDSFSPHTKHNGVGVVSSPVKVNPNERQLSLYCIKLTIFAYFLPPLSWVRILSRAQFGVYILPF